jgi:hypothetical protein
MKNHFVEAISFFQWHKATLILFVDYGIVSLQKPKSEKKKKSSAL